MGIGQTILDILSYLFWLRSRGVNEPESERIGVDVVIHTTHKWALKLGSRFIASCALLAFFLCCVFTHSVYFSLFVSLDCFDSRILNPVDGRTFDDPSQSASQRAQVGSCSTLIVQHSGLVVVVVVVYPSETKRTRYTEQNEMLVARRRLSVSECCCGDVDTSSLCVSV